MSKYGSILSIDHRENRKFWEMIMRKKKNNKGNKQIGDKAHECHQ